MHEYWLETRRALSDAINYAILLHSMCSLLFSVDILPLARPSLRYSLIQYTSIGGCEVCGVWVDYRCKCMGSFENKV